MIGCNIAFPLCLSDFHTDFVSIFPVLHIAHPHCHSVDYLLPVQIGQSTVGVVYRKTECTLILMDGYDISNKAVLCDPSFNVMHFQWTQNTYNRLRVVTDKVIRPMNGTNVSKPMKTNKPKLFVQTNERQSTESVETASVNSVRSMVSTPMTPRSVSPESPASPQVPSLSLSAYSVQTPQSTPNLESPPLIVQRVAMSDEQLVRWTNDMIQSTLEYKAYLDDVRFKNHQFSQNFTFSNSNCYVL